MGEASRARTGGHNRHKIIFVLGVACTAVATFLLLWLSLSQLEVLRSRYAELLALLTRWEETIASLENRWLLIIVLFLLFALKSFVTLYPLSALFIISGMVFDVQYATAINIVGIIILISAKFFWGEKYGGGKVYDLIKRSRMATELLNLEGDGNPWLLVLLRFVPIIPVNIVSRLYGASSIEYDRFLLLSLLGFAPRLISYSVLGNHVFDPFSVGFLVPIIVLFYITGISLLILVGVLNLVKAREQKSPKAEAD